MIIKHKAKRFDNGAYVISDQIKKSETDSRQWQMYDYSLQDWVDIDESSANRETGYHDKNGNPIFEGDSVMLRGEKCVVEWGHNEFIVYHDAFCWDLLAEVMGGDIEIIE